MNVGRNDVVPVPGSSASDSREPVCVGARELDSEIAVDLKVDEPRQQEPFAQLHVRSAGRQSSAHRYDLAVGAGEMAWS